MRLLFLIAIVILGLCSMARAQVQTINTNQGIGCNGITSLGNVTKCVPGQTYGCQALQTNTTILLTDGNRTSIQFQNTGVTPITLTFGDSAVAGVNGFLVQPGNSYLWSNMPQGNTPGRVTTGPISIITTAGALNSCVFMYTD